MLQFPLQYFHLNAHSIYTHPMTKAIANLLSFVFLVTSLFTSIRNGYLNFTLTIFTLLVEK